MSLQTVKYTESLRTPWDDFIDGSLNGTILHKRGFYDSNTANVTDDHSLLFFKKNKIAAVIPANLQNKEGRFIFQSHGRATYGGMIINEEIGVKEAIEIVGMLIEEAKQFNVSEIIIRNPFRIFYKRMSDEMDYALWYHGFQLKSREAEVYIDLSDSEEIIKKRYENGTKYNIKKAWKFVSVKKSEDIADFWQLLEKNLQEKHEKSPVHNYEDIQLLRKNVGEENIIFFGAYHENTLAGGCLVFKINNALHAQYIAQDNQYQEFRPVNAVLDFIIGWAKENGFRYFNLGTANEGGKIINEGLFHFKESFGGRSILRETMHLNLEQTHE